MLMVRVNTGQGVRGRGEVMTDEAIHPMAVYRFPNQAESCAAHYI